MIVFVSCVYGVIVIFTGMLFTERPLDREVSSLYHVPIVARDGGGRVGYTMVRVNVADQGDHKPQFIMSEYKANIYASTEIDASVLQVGFTV